MQVIIWKTYPSLEEEYGIDTDKSAPGWPIMLLNSYFEGQRKSAILTNEGGLTIVRMKVKNVPVAVEIKEDAPDRLFMEDCIFENVQRTGLILTDAGNAATQINLRNIQCKNVPVFSLERSTNEQVSGKGKTYQITRFHLRLQCQQPRRYSPDST